MIAKRINSQISNGYNIIFNIKRICVSADVFTVFYQRPYMNQIRIQILPKFSFNYNWSHFKKCLQFEFRFLFLYVYVKFYKT